MNRDHEPEIDDQNDRRNDSCGKHESFNEDGDAVPDEDKNRNIIEECCQHHWKDPFFAVIDHKGGNKLPEAQLDNQHHRQKKVVHENNYKEELLDCERDITE
jgi:hypothetical protein